MAISKGSWRVKIISAKGKDYRIEDGEGNVIVYGSGHITDNAPDNAQAIAALPELVDALRALAAVYSGMEDGDGNPCPTIERARALLARMDGL